MLSFLAPDIVSVEASYAAGLQNEGVGDGATGERTRYGAYLRDPDGNKIHIVSRNNDEAWLVDSLFSLVREVNTNIMPQ